jgi:hypothetical protein
VHEEGGEGETVIQTAEVEHSAFGVQLFGLLVVYEAFVMFEGVGGQGVVEEDRGSDEITIETSVVDDFVPKASLISQFQNQAELFQAITLLSQPQLAQMQKLTLRS